MKVSSLVKRVLRILLYLLKSKCSWHNDVSVSQVKCSLYFLFQKPLFLTVCFFSSKERGFQTAVGDAYYNNQGVPSYSQGAAKTYPGSRFQICAIVIHPTKIDYISTFIFDYTVHLHLDEINVVWFVLFYYAFVSNSVFSSKIPSRHITSLRCRNDFDVKK